MPLVGLGEQWEGSRLGRAQCSTHAGRILVSSGATQGWWVSHWVGLARSTPLGRPGTIAGFQMETWRVQSDPPWCPHTAALKGQDRNGELGCRGGDHAAGRLCGAAMAATDPHCPLSAWRASWAAVASWGSAFGWRPRRGTLPPCPPPSRPCRPPTCLWSPAPSSWPSASWAASGPSRSTSACC